MPKARLRPSNAGRSPWRRCAGRADRPGDAPSDGDFAREVARDSGQYRERAVRTERILRVRRDRPSLRRVPRRRWRRRRVPLADFPLALGEAIMMNHTLFAGLLHAGQRQSPTTHSIAGAGAQAAASHAGAAIRHVIAIGPQAPTQGGALAAAALTDTRSSSRS